MSILYKELSEGKADNLYNFSRLLDRLIEKNEVIFKTNNTFLNKDGYLCLMTLIRNEFKSLELYYESEENNGINY
jgi:hypothetical protein